MIIPGGSKIYSADLTATASDVLKGKIYIGADTDDDVGVGTMPENGAVAKTLNCGESYSIPYGYHNGKGSVAVNSLASQTSASLDAAHMQLNYTAWSKGSRVTGSVQYRGTNQYGTFSYGSDYCQITLPEGIYKAEGNSWAPEARAYISQVASALGLTADKIKKGVTILGITGTWQGYA